MSKEKMDAESRFILSVVFVVVVGICIVVFFASSCERHKNQERAKCVLGVTKLLIKTPNAISSIAHRNCP